MANGAKATANNEIAPRNNMAELEADGPAKELAADTPKIKIGMARGRIRMGATIPPRFRVTLMEAPMAPKAAKAGVPSNKAAIVARNRGNSINSITANKGVAKIRGRAVISQWEMIFAKEILVKEIEAWRSDNSVPSS